MAGYVLDAGVLQGLAKDVALGVGPMRDLLPVRERLVTIDEVMDECYNVPESVLRYYGITLEPTRAPEGFEGLLDAFSSGLRPLHWQPDMIPKADRAVVAHAIASELDIMTTDGALARKSFRDFLKRVDRLTDDKLPAWYIPEIYVVRRLVH